MPLSATIKASIEATQTRSLDLATGTAPLLKAISQALADGAGADQANLLWHDQRTLAASANEDIDLAGTLTDAFGQAVVFARIKAILVKAAAANSNDVNVSRAAANGVPLFLAAGDGLPIKPDGFFLWVAPDAAGIVVTAGSGDLLNIANSGAGTGVTYDIVIIGAAT